MAYVTITKDFSEVKNPILAGLTLRQIVFFGIGIVFGVSSYIFTYKNLGTTISLLLMMIIISPFGLMALYTKDGKPFEIHLMYYLEMRFRRNTPRPYISQNIYNELKKKEELNKEVRAILKKSGTKATISKGIIIPKNGKIDSRTKKELERTIAKYKRQGKIPVSAQESIPYRRIFPDGICEVTNGYYTRTLVFQDITYQLLDRADKGDIFEYWCEFLNYFDSSIHFQFSYANREIDKEEISKLFYINQTGDEFDFIRKEYSDMQLSQLSKSNNNMVKERHLTFGIKAKSYKDAKVRLEKITIAVEKNLMRFNCKSAVLDGYNRLKLLHAIFHPASKERFCWNFDIPINSGMTSKDFIVPSSFDFSPSAQLNATKYFRMGDRIGCVSYIKIFAADMEDRIIAELLSINSNILINFHVEAIEQPHAIKSAKNELTDLQQKKVKEQQKSAIKGYDMDILPPDLVEYEEGAHKLLDNLQKKNERLFNATITVMITANSRKELEESIFECNGILSPYQCSLIRLDNRQEQGLMSSLPLGYNSIEILRTLTTTNLAIFIPFTTQEMFIRNGQYYGMNALSNNVINANRKLLLNPNGLVFGKPGSGKTFAVKREIFDIFLKTNDDRLVIDPEGEYKALVKLLKGQLIEISINSKDYVNPMHINLSKNLEDKEYDAVSSKCNFVVSLCELILGGNQQLSKTELAVLDICCRNVYIKFLETPSLETMPILEDLYNELKIYDGRGSEVAKDLALMLHKFVNGSLSYFNHRTNVDINHRLVCFDIKEMDSSMRDLSMLIIQEAIWDRVAENRKLKKTTWVDIDEFHLLLRNPLTASYMVEIWKRFRKWGGIPTGITQNVKDLFRSPEIQNILDTTDFILMLNQAGDDARILAEHLNISEDEENYIKTGEAGKGLLFAGNTKIPFIDAFPTDTQMYKVMTTRPDEMIT